MSTPAIAVEGLVAGHDGVAVVRDLSFTVNSGEVVALLGPNGAGKTTTLMTLAGLISPLEGSVEMLGESTVGASPQRLARRGLAYVPEERSLFYDLTVAENVDLGVRGRRAARRQAIDKAFDVLPGLRPLADRKAGLLSGGEQQMLAMARAVVSEPRVLLVDELSLGLAPIIVERLLPIVCDVARDTNCGVLIVEQHVQMALAVADRGIVVNNGRLRAEGASADLLADRDLLEDTYLG